MAGGVIGHLQRRPPVLQPRVQHVDHEVAPLEHPRGQLACRAFLRLSSEQLGIVHVQHRAAGARRHHHGNRLGKQRKLVTGHRARLATVARVERWLAAAGLRLGEDHAHTLALEELHGRQPGVRKQHVDQAGAVKVHRLGLGRVAARRGMSHGRNDRRVTLAGPAAACPGRGSPSAVSLHNPFPHHKKVKRRWMPHTKRSRPPSAHPALPRSGPATGKTLPRCAPPSPGPGVPACPGWRTETAWAPARRPRPRAGRSP